MKQPTKYYFLAPPDILPDTTLQLGQLFTSLKHPHRRLASPSPIDPSKIQPVAPVSPWEWSYDLSSSTECNLSVTAGALAQQIGPDISASLSKGATIEFRAEKLETVTFEPDKAYLDECMATERVREFLKTRLRMRHLYIITGVKVAHDGVKREVFRKGRDFKLGVAGDGSGVGAPLAGQVGVGKVKAREVGETGSFAGARVVAIRIERVILKWRIMGSGGATGKTEPVVKGAVMENRAGGGDGEESGEEEEEHEEVAVLSGCSLDEEIVGADEKDFGGVPYRLDQCVEDDGSDGCFLVSLQGEGLN
ncbi:hypothetical protein B0T16DRAFT_488885 [Cercophora newfieldiana]|uniref:Uncharacterized protein n=1 Tax=Cercophora newfieldiana TaxID=92897 RepID=A0AA39YUF3_9PEZI|nr:hypothetical protein B0T16DRAFT_488885 [Cercophora newfieldiana]